VADVTSEAPASPEPAPLSRAERARRGKAARAGVPRRRHDEVEPAGRRDPLALLEQQAASREPALVPIRYGRMLVSPLAFFRGSAVIMAGDLARTPSSGIRVQLCGDAHLSNFGVFGSPERKLVFDINDFDETAPGPWEWDVKRLATSFAIAGRENGFPEAVRRVVVHDGVRAYREAIRSFALMRNLDVWYAHLDIEHLLQTYEKQVTPRRMKRTEAQLARARTHDSMHAFEKLTRLVDGQPRIISEPPLIVPVDELLPGVRERDDLGPMIRGLMRTYRHTLQRDRRALLEQFRLVDIAHKVVGVGSVGTRDWIILFLGVDGEDPLFLQMKEAQPSVLERYAGKSEYANHGQRVVVGQRLMQAVSDIFLGWQRTTGLDGRQRDFFVRQLKDWKGSAVIDEMPPGTMAAYARMCGWTLARAHARSGDRIAIAAYLGKADVFDQAVASFAETYADQNECDHGALQKAVDTGRITALGGV
jgi:uncharacterized protein (DUF2252 family)